VKKKPKLFSHCGSFDHPDLQSLNNYKFDFLGLPPRISRILGLFNMPLEQS
jgi:hypothetical protein